MAVYGENQIKFVSNILGKDVLDTFKKWVEIQTASELKENNPKTRWTSEED